MQTGQDNHTLISLKACTEQPREKKARGKGIRLFERQGELIHLGRIVTQTALAWD